MSKVLVADDSATIRGVAESLLRHNGYEVISTSDGTKALAMAKSQNPDLIFLDHVIPGKDGLAVCRELKADPHTRNIPVIMLLGAGEAREAEKFLTAGASDYLVKPFVPKDFIEKAQKHLSPFAQGSTLAQDTGKIAASSLLEEALSSAGKEEEELDLEKLLGAASSRQLEEETGKVPTLPSETSSKPVDPGSWGPANPDEMTIKLYSQEEKTKPKYHERPRKPERPKTAGGSLKSDSDKLKAEKEKDDLILTSNPFGLGEEESNLAFGTGGSPEVPHDYDWFLKEMQKESQAPSGPSKKPTPVPPPTGSKRKEETSEELRLKVEEMGTSRLGYERFINEFKKEMMKLETEEKPVYGETKIDPQAVVEAQLKVKTDKVKIASAPGSSTPTPVPVPTALAINSEELVNQVVAAVVREVAQKISSQLDKEEILRLLQEKLGKLGR